MSNLLSALPWVLACNLWVAVGCVVLVAAIDRAVVERPRNLIHSIVWMCLWPVLLLKGVRALIGGRPSPTSTSSG